VTRSSRATGSAATRGATTGSASTWASSRCRWSWSIPGFYHLDTCFCPLSETAAIYYPGAFDDYGRSVLAARIPQLIEVSAEESVSFSCNAVVVGRTVVLNEGVPKLTRALELAGYAVRPLRLTEFIKAGGSAKCLTLRLDGEEAASWRRGSAAVAMTS